MSDVTRDGLLGRPAYQPLWLAARRRLELNGRSLDGSPLVLKGLSGLEADAIAGLLGVRRPAPGSPLRIPLPTLDETLRTSSVGRGLAEVLTDLGGPIVDRRAAKAAVAASRAEQWTDLGGHPAVIADPRLAGWLDAIARSGLDRRVAGTGAAVAMSAALDVLAVVERGSGEGGAGAHGPGEHGAGEGGGKGAERETAGRHRLAVLAADVAGDAHALDRGRPMGTLVVNALSWLRGQPFPIDAADWRRVWAEAGVACDDLSCDTLVLNLPGFERGPWRLTLRQVMAWYPPPVASSGGVAFACENPAVVAAAADELAEASPPLVCVEGMPSTASLVVLDRMARAGYEVGYHGDFDWRGLAIAAVVARKVPASGPWLYGAVEYRQAVDDGLGTVELTGRPSGSPWSDDLPAAMAAAGLAIYEEQVISRLLDDLRHTRS